MAVQIILKNSSIEDKRPQASQLTNGEISLNYNENGAFLCCKDTDGNLQQVGGVKIDEDAPDAPVKQTQWFKPSTLTLSVFDGDKWLPIAGGGSGGGGGGAIDQIIGNDGIDADEVAGIVTLDIELAGGDDGLEFKSSKLSATLASATDLGSVKVGENIDVTAGKISVAKADTSTFGVVKVGNGLGIAGDGTLFADVPKTTTYRGSCDLSADPTGQLNPEPPEKGDAYINSADTSTVDAGWTGITGSAKIGDLVIFDGTQWDLIPLGSGGGGTAPVTSVNTKIGDVVLDYTDVGAASAAQGDLADTALQSGDNISELNNDEGYITLAEIPAQKPPVISSATAPTGADAVEGNLWFNTNDGRTYVYYKDGDSSQWVDASPDSGGAGGTVGDYWLEAGGYLSPKTSTNGVDIGGSNILLNADGSITAETRVTADQFFSIGSGKYAFSTRPSGVGAPVTSYIMQDGDAAFGIEPDGSINIELNKDGSSEFAGDMAIGITGSFTPSTPAITLRADGTSTLKGLAKVQNTNTEVYDPNTVNHLGRNIEVQNLSDTIGSYSGIRFITTSTGNNGAAGIYCVNKDDLGNADLVFTPRNNTTGESEKLRITSEGEVKIGVTGSFTPSTPAISLNADGSINAAGEVTSTTGFNALKDGSSNGIKLGFYSTLFSGIADERARGGLYNSNGGGGSISIGLKNTGVDLGVLNIYDKTNNVIVSELKGNGGIEAKGLIRTGSTGSSPGSQGAYLNPGDDTNKRANLIIYSQQETGSAIGVATAPDTLTNKTVRFQVETDGRIKTGTDVSYGAKTTTLIDPVDGIKIGGVMPDAPNISLNAADGSAQFNNQVKIKERVYIGTGAGSSGGTGEAAYLQAYSDTGACLKIDKNKVFTGSSSSAENIFVQCSSSAAPSTPRDIRWLVTSDGSHRIGGNVPSTPNISLDATTGSGTFAGRLQTPQLFGSVTNSTASDYRVLNVYNTSLTQPAAYKASIFANGDAEFQGTVTANGKVLTRNVELHLEADDDTKYTATTNEDGEQTLVYNGATLDVKDRLQKADAALLALKTAAVAATDFASLKAAIVTALADI